MAAEAKRLKRFSIAQRLWHLALVVIFFLMGITGLAWMYIETGWGRMLAAPFGGWQGALEWHRIAGLVLLALFALHILYSLMQIEWRHPFRWLAGPDSLMMQFGDVKGFFQHLGWIFGLREHPRYDRWSWYEKFDYWAVWWGFMIVGVTGLVLYNPVLSSDYMPGWLINVALWIHRIEALMAMVHIFTVHFYLEHFRPKALPFNAAMFDGTIPMSEAEEAHGAWVDRLEMEGKLEAHLVPEPPVALRIAYFIGGYALIALGIFLLVFAFANVAAVSLF
ncbi:formate dehydrogenase subunit gamma [Aliiruegeria lutimaris]|uniref:Cytochrome b subunit of formate dehydrogenase n=1 Tax=Aliiruegeria lutimaris TaxID=571298 RepID=A0A1G8UVL4_9RHOB|nr:cytochrome b/b6 domain-containing protein [Aliiruegeria lutimaris]SDJ57912.1 Cytochrome b subunit of formate dehydrogenase [Aliiruegeria lutimaris]